MGGITELSKVFAMANASSTTVVVHTFYDGPGLLAAIHASAALGGPRALVEWRYFDLEAQLYGEAIIPKNGAIAIPQGAGLGLEPSADVIGKIVWPESAVETPSAEQPLIGRSTRRAATLSRAG